MITGWNIWNRIIIPAGQANVRRDPQEHGGRQWGGEKVENCAAFTQNTIIIAAFTSVLQFVTNVGRMFLTGRR